LRTSTTTAVSALQGMADPDMKLRSGDPDESWNIFEGKFAWDVVVDIPHPLCDAKDATKEEMGHIMKKIFEVVKKEKPFGSLA
jgi:hypothetical protein